MARGLSTMLESIIKELGSKANDTFNSQDQLSGSLDRLVQELDQLLENAPLPFVVQHASRISSCQTKSFFEVQHASRISSCQTKSFFDESGA